MLNLCQLLTECLTALCIKVKQRAGRNIKRYRLENKNEEAIYVQGLSLQSPECSMG